MPSPTNEYRYDVFFSYKRHDETLEWTRNLQKSLRLWLSEEIGRSVNLFVDDETIEVGDHWPERLRQGLKFSRCMVCLWSPLYFQSSWCLSEWKSFLEREKRVKMSSHELIIPLRFTDGEHFPQEAKDIKDFDLRPYASALPVFWASSRALDLEDKIKELATSIAKRLDKVPPFQSDWPIVESQRGPDQRIPLPRL
jgi:hypothetical protein